MDRRDFLRLSTFTAGAWLLSESLPLHGASAATAATAFRPSPLVRLDADGSATLYVIKQEMGQGVRTALALLIAEELDVDFERVHVASLAYDPATASQYNTWASSSIRSGWNSARKAGAAARAMLVQAAAARWNVAPGACATEPGRVVERASGKSLAYTELLEAASALPVPRDPPLKDPRAYRLIGKPGMRLEVRDKASGRQQYGIDMTLPGMLYATIVRAPTFYGKVKHVDDSAVRALGAGIIDVIEVHPMPGCDNRNGVAILATSTWLALQAQALLKVDWERGSVPHADSASLSRALRAAPDQDAPALVFGARAKATAYAPIDAAEGKLAQAEYELPFLTHAAMEPLNCTAWFREGRYEIWGGFQAPGFFASTLPKAFGVDKTAIVLHPQAMGGAFGRKEKVDNAAEAMQLSRACGRPVKLVFSRPDDTRNGFYRPASVHRLAALSDAAGVHAWRHQVAVATFPAKAISSPQDIYGGPAGDLCYPIADVRSAFYPVESPVPIGSWRSIAYSHNVFAVESFIDELAVRAGADPLRFRLDMLRRESDDGQQEHRVRLAAVLARCGEAVGWDRPAPAGIHRGVACCVYAHTHAYVAHAFEIAVSARQQITIRRAVCVVDCGLIVDPSGFRAQIEGSMVWALSAAFTGEVTVKDGEVQQQNFSDYEVLRLNQMPPLEIIVIPSTEAPGGAGEPAVPSVAPALCNAIFAATGKRVRTLPLRKALFTLT
jgi:isoquinoline 1-oxidoreductase subunit beta